LKSKIVNMADSMRDSEDAGLERLFASEPIADDGFSAAIVKRIRRRLWVRGLILPVAAAIGASIAFRPLLSLAISLGNVLEALPIPADVTTAVEQLPSLPMLVTGGVLFGAMLLGIRLLED
jgi:hypothetical protein